MIIRNNKELQARYYGSRAIGKVYYGILLVWEAVASCFGGIWLNAQRFVNGAPYKNSK